MRTVQGCWIARLLIVASFGLLVIVGPWSTTAQAQYWPCGCSYCPAGPVQGVVPGLPPEGTEESPPCNPDDQCCQAENTADSSNPVDLWNGREFFSHTDLVLPGMMDIVIRRSHDSQAEYDSALGYGWALNYFMRLYEYADGSVILRRDCGLRRSFFYEAGAYQTPVGESGTLVKNGDGSWTYSEKSGDRESSMRTANQRPSFPFRGRVSCSSMTAGESFLSSAFRPMPSILKHREVAQEFRLTRIDEQDGRGQTTGRWVELAYNEDTGRVSTVTDSAGRTVQYFHDDIGNLEQSRTTGERDTNLCLRRSERPT